MISNKEQLEKQHSMEMNKNAVESIQKGEVHDEISNEEKEKIIFQDCEAITLRDNKTYYIPPLTLKNARILMKKLQTINVDVIILNFLPSEDGSYDTSRENDLYDILEMAFVNYPNINRDYIDEYIDLDQARTIIDILIGLNALKK
ncbi:hypothetical protein ACSVDA_12000 [Cytobacillus sp. Hm23]